MAPMSTMNTTNILNTLLMFLPILCLYLAVPTALLAVLEYFLSKLESPWPGRVLPILSVVPSLGWALVLLLNMAELLHPSLYFLPLAVLGSAFVGLVLWWFSRHKSRENPYILVLHCADAQAEDAAKALVDGAVKKWNLKSKSVTPGQIELNYEVRLREGDAYFVNTLGGMAGVTNVVLVSYNGDYMG